MDHSKEDLGQRKADHIQMAFNAKVALTDRDDRFLYEPMLMGHPDRELTNIKCQFLGKELNAPLWISSMTGGTEKAFTINQRLARMCAKHGLGMGLGSIRPILDDGTRLKDFNLRPILGKGRPFYANLGIAQIDDLLKTKSCHQLEDILQKLDVDGLVIHVNPLQEFLQPEGDRFTRPPIDIIQDYLEVSSGKIIVKEVGQGMGKNSLKSLMNLDIDGIELAGFGGTNFSKLELMRGSEMAREVLKDFVFVGHSPEEMISEINKILVADRKKDYQIIISGGINSLLDGHYLMEKCLASSVIGMASHFLKYALKSEEELDEFVLMAKKALSLSKTMLTIKESGH